MVYQVVKTRRFLRSVKRMNPGAYGATHSAIAEIIENPAIGEAKKSDLESFFVYKFRALDLQFLIAYGIDLERNEIVLWAVGPHENFYRDLKR